MYIPNLRTVPQKFLVPGLFPASSFFAVGVQFATFKDRLLVQRFGRSIISSGCLILQVKRAEKVSLALIINSGPPPISTLQVRVWKRIRYIPIRSTSMHRMMVPEAAAAVAVAVAADDSDSDDDPDNVSLKI